MSSYHVESSGFGYRKTLAIENNEILHFIKVKTSQPSGKVMKECRCLIL